MSFYPQKTDNRNVPKDVFLVSEAETKHTSDGTLTTHLIDLEGNCWRVCSWIQSGIRSSFPFELCRLTGDTWKMIEVRYDSWKRQREEGEG